MSTKKQIAANRRNAQHSTGPRTPEGKAKSSGNALTHGLTSAQVLAPSESADDFDAHATSLRDHFAPADPLEALLVDQIIVAAWRLRRSRILERFILEQRATDIEREAKRDGVRYTDPADYLALAFREDCNNSTALDKLSRHETRIERAFYRALREFDRRGAGVQPAAVASATEKSILQIEPISPQVLQPVELTEAPSPVVPTALVESAALVAPPALVGPAVLPASPLSAGLSKKLVPPPPPTNPDFHDMGK